MCTIHVETIGKSHAKLYDHGFKPTGKDRTTTIWTNAIGDTAQIVLNLATGDFEPLLVARKYSAPNNY